MSKGLIVAADPERFQKDFETGKMHSVVTIANGGADVVLDADKIHWKAKTAETEGIRKANTPIGVVNANVMKKVDDQLSGMAPTVVTRKYIKLPLFDNSTHAYANPWGSAYGTLAPGDYVKSDLNGRFVKFVEGTDKESQKVGQVLAIQNYLVPEGAAVWASWALEDKLNTEYYNPDETVPTSTGEYPGYPYDKGYGYNELKNPSPRLPLQYELGKGIPGLTDGANVASTTISDQVVDEVPVGTFETMQNRYMRLKDVNVESLQVAVKASFGATVQTSDYADVADLVAENALKMKDEAGTGTIDLGHLDFADAKAGLLVLAVDTAASLATANLTKVEILVKYVKRGLAGVPTMLDWDGCTGEVRVLLQK
jgi:hypothetical protein